MMAIEAIGAAMAGAITNTNTADIARSTAIAPQTVQRQSFLAAIGDELIRVDEQLKTADSQLRGLAAGQDIPLHDVMITMERARLDLMLVAEVRNRLVEAYQELTRMQL